MLIGCPQLSLDDWKPNFECTELHVRFACPFWSFCCFIVILKISGEKGQILSSLHKGSAQDTFLSHFIDCSTYICLRSLNVSVANNSFLSYSLLTCMYRLQNVGQSALYLEGFASSHLSFSQARPVFSTGNRYVVLSSSHFTLHGFLCEGIHCISPYHTAVAHFLP